MTDTTIVDKATEQRRASLKKARQTLANQRAAEREAIFAKSGDHAPKSSAPPSEFEGLTATECCDACSDKGCVVSGSWYCAHPMKAGLQSTEKGSHVALKRFKRAKEFLKDAKLDLEKMSE